ncbi:LamG-like jellyroll fold domain-containing protein [Micromonospora auratinigra]|uniref:Carboxypeptidase regulatory-like domain-containing protein n=1 Tax=Micromonospora auratinigra TaxID=261654 RepID=A0A1A9AAE4_9ACTN|nr:LamG-like jellyroll fold domain-containing protein [Micromonospora auratinigra]SBT53105.1 Carboxypeptidase regulatory-like domain-containing protein [Micromonospora auratinigra]
MPGAGRSRRPVALLLALLLPLTAVAAVRTPAAAAAPATRCPDSAPDETAAVRAAAACHGQVEVASARGEKVQVLANPNGSFTARSAAVVQRVRDARGRWVAPDPTLHRTVEGRLVPAATSLAISFSGGGTGPAATIGKGSAEVSLHWPTALPAPRIAGPRATYPDVLPGVDLVLTAGVEGYSELLVVRDARAAANPALATVRFRTTARGLRLRQGRAGDVTAVDDAGSVLFGSGTPAMWDSSTPGDRAAGPNLGSRLVRPGARSGAMPVRLAGADLVIRPDLTMLRAKATRFPVYIDPALGKSAWTMINSTFPSQSYWSYDRQDCPDPYGSIQCAKVGYTTVPQSMIYRSLFAFGIGTLLHKHVQDAKLSMDTVYSYTNTDYGTQVRVTGGISSGTTWSNNAGSWGAVVATANSHAHDRVRRRTEWGVTGAVQKAAGGTNGTLTFGLRAVDESDKNHWKKFDAGTALLTVIYNSYPNAPDNLSVANGPCRTGTARPYVRTLTPALSARLTDPDGTARLLKGTFYWWKLSGGSRNGTDSVAQGSVVAGQYAHVTIPAGRLTDGGIYVVQAITYDGIDSGQYSTTCEFQVDVTPPGAPSGVTSTTYPNDGQAHGGVGTAGSFTFKPPTTVPADFDGYAYTLDPGVSAASATQVTAGATDHTATVSLTPVVDQTYNLRVWSRDKAGNFSTSPYTYTFSVRAGTGPDARWMFDDQAGTDISAHGNTLTVTGGSWVAGRGSFGKALLLDGTAAYAATGGPITTRDPQTGGPVTVHSNRSFSVATTVRLDSTAGSGQRVIVAQDGSRTSPFLLSYSVTDKKWRFAVAGSDADAPATVAVLSNTTVATGVWTRLLATYDGTTHALKLYVNGVLQTATATGTTFDATGPVTVGRGRWAGAPAAYFPGAVDDVRVYGRAVLSTESEFTLLQLPNPPIVTTPGGTTAYVGQSLSAVLSAGGDPAVTKVQYQLGVSGTVTTVALPTAGGQTTVSLTGTTVGTPMLLVQGIDTAGAKSPVTSTLLTFKEAPALTGQVVDAITDAPLAGITVELNPGNLTRTTSATGTYSFTGIAAGTYEVTATNGGNGCAGEIATTEVDLDRVVTIDLRLAPESDVYGYTCKTTPNTPFVAGTTKLSVLNLAQIALPFPLPYYGRTYSAAWVSPYGAVTFKDPGDTIPFRAVSLPDRAKAPHAAVFPFWDDVYVDSQSSIWTATTGSGAGQRFLVEWRNVTFYNSSARFSFEVQFAPDGNITFSYSGATDDRSKGGSAAVGITSPGGGYGLEYSFQDPVLTSGTAVTFVAPADPWPLSYGSLSGTVLRDGHPVRQAQLVLGQEVATSDDLGHYSFGDLEWGTYGVEANQACDAANAPNVEVDGDVTLDLPLTTYVDDYGYSCTWEQEAWIPGDTVVPGGAGDVTLPFAFPFYGGHWTSAYVCPGQLWNDSPADGSAGGEIEFWPGGNRIYDAQSSTLTAVVGTAPNRQFVIEARNYSFEERPDVRLSWETILGEDGTVKMIFKDPPDPSVMPYIAAIYLHPYDHDARWFEDNGEGFPTGKSVVIHPPVTP